MLCLIQVSFRDEDNNGQMLVDLVTLSARKPCSDMDLSVPGKDNIIPSLLCETRELNSLTIIQLFLSRATCLPLLCLVTKSIPCSFNSSFSFALWNTRQAILLVVFWRFREVHIQSRVVFSIFKTCKIISPGKH